MDITQVYAAVLGGSILLMFYINVHCYVVSIVRAFSWVLSNHLVYPQIVRRHRFLGPWSRADVLLQLVYIAANFFCVGFGATTAHVAGVRAARLSLINLFPTFAGLHFGFLADFLGLRLSTYRYIHRSAAYMSCTLLVLHVLIVVLTHGGLSFGVQRDLWGFIVSL